MLKNDQRDIYEWDRVKDSCAWVIKNLKQLKKIILLFVCSLFYKWRRDISIKSSVRINMANLIKHYHSYEL